MSYLLWKTLHIASVVLFLGNITTGLFWAAQARRSHDLSLLAATFDSIGKSDRWLTLPSVAGIIISGVAAASLAGLPLLRTPWILWSLVLFGVSGIIFGIRVAPLQRELATLARKGNADEIAWKDINRAYLRWELWGLAALLTPAAALVLMVLKPVLPAL